MSDGRTETLLEGLVFPEGPRWHDERLVFSDMHDQRVVALDPLTRSAETVCTLDDDPSGLGWLPDGRMLVVAMRTRQVLRREPDGHLALHASLAALAPYHCNDMVVGADGRAYVGNFGFDLHAGASPVSTVVLTVSADGTAAVAADDLGFPNGMVITPDGRTLIVGESFGGRLTAFTIGADGMLSERRVFARLDGAVPDGICLDAEGAVWIACPMSHRCLRVAEGGEILDEISVGERGAFACMLGGTDRRTLFVCTARGFGPEDWIEHRGGAILAAEVAVPGAGWP